MYPVIYIMGGLCFLGLIALCGFIVYLWQKSAKQETKRLYAFIDDMFDRIGSENIERYALCNRIKRDLLLQQVNTKIEPTDDDAKKERAFIHQKR